MQKLVNEIKKELPKLNKTYTPDYIKDNEAFIVDVLKIVQELASNAMSVEKAKEGSEIYDIAMNSDCGKDTHPSADRCVSDVTKEDFIAGFDLRKFHFECLFEVKVQMKV